MLGKTLSDPYNVEGGGKIRGMGLLDAETIFEKEKVRTQAEGGFCTLNGIFSPLSDMKISGYEIHMGETENLGACGLLAVLTDILGHSAEKSGGLISADGLTAGTYLHGIFDEKDVAETLADILLKRRGIEPRRKTDFDLKEYRENEYDRLAGLLRKSLDMDMIYKIVNGGAEA